MGHRQLSITLAGSTYVPHFNKLILKTTCPDVLQVLVECHVARLAGDAASSAPTFQQLVEGVDMLEHARRLLWPQPVQVTTALDDPRLTDTQEPLLKTTDVSGGSKASRIFLPYQSFSSSDPGKVPLS